jgi:hypothetical protein
MGWEIPWYSALGSLEILLIGRRIGRMHIVCYLRQGAKVFETYWMILLSNTSTPRAVVPKKAYHSQELVQWAKN